ncbi:GNAT family N-acetyltransferase [Viridibacillus sp. FSL R5-0477]|uniref:Acetyltransferase (GNAT) family protein n=1 Tax=Viridibacillus arenosi FSL R5-213 TaxID=1227360 RepID=W4F664_9BACL|nr:GNAT family N-acetyltransferase [Viridibacillus arenosi]ETT87784.1 Acetyltransferase (GNAT) family protein [Viridibacillus arenosi FSL R5-213]OMC89801.1 N-acetyltransferase [Viridibacillus arenosi]
MNWFGKLNEYFPVEEMKSRQHIELLLKDKIDIYKKVEDEKYVLIYVDHTDFIFVDYLYVSLTARGEGLGGKILEHLKGNGKPILLEVESLAQAEDDTEKRLRFYKRHHFNLATQICYCRHHVKTGEPLKMDIHYWAPTGVAEEEILGQMKWVYENIHAYKDEFLYGAKYEPTDNVLFMTKK